MDFIMHFTSGILGYLGFFWLIPGSGIYALIGSVLPDLIDKPLAIFINPKMGRLLAHSLLFVIFLMVCAIAAKILFNTNKIFPLPIMAFGHQLMDQMYTLPQNWFYPFLEEPIVRLDTFDVQAHFFQEIQNPYFIPCIIIAALFWYFFTSRQIRH
jgi:membrane-bound metal-dependent hydrolase YbcI (DUF457 family)